MSASTEMSQKDTRYYYLGKCALLACITDNGPTDDANTAPHELPSFSWDPDAEHINASGNSEDFVANNGRFHVSVWQREGYWPSYSGSSAIEVAPIPSIMFGPGNRIDLTEDGKMLAPEHPDSDAWFVPAGITRDGESDPAATEIASVKLGASETGTRSASRRSMDWAKGKLHRSTGAETMVVAPDLTPDPRRRQLLLRPQAAQNAHIL